jgi:C-terminal processing protease CtpA/Prc
LLEGVGVVASEGESIENVNYDDLVRKIRGPAGCIVHLTVRRGDATLEFNVVRRRLRQE